MSKRILGIFIGTLIIILLIMAFKNFKSKNSTLNNNLINKQPTTNSTNIDKEYWTDSGETAL